MRNDTIQIPRKVTKVISIGYEGRTLDTFIQCLKGLGIRKLLDVRELPLSRKPGFSKKTLSGALEVNDIEYWHLRIAGNPYRHEKKDINHCLQLYAEHLIRNPQIINDVVAHLGEHPVAVLCYERDHRHCHRSVLLGAIMSKGNLIRICEV